LLVFWFFRLIILVWFSFVLFVLFVVECISPFGHFVVPIRHLR